MPQETNLNVSPYFDDFDPQKNYYKVLFKPGYPVQARELTGLQSILQNQIEKFGNHIFKEGSVVIPGNVNSSTVPYVEIQNSFNGILVDSYIDNLLDKVIIGETTGLRAKVVYILKSNELDNTNTVLYLQYLDSNSGSSTSVFQDSENLLSESTINPGFSDITSILQNQSFAISTDTNSVGEGTIASVNDGVYFLRGTFVSVYSQKLVVDYNNSDLNYRVGFDIFEEIVNSDMDESLNDNSKGFSNYAASGADRFKITASLAKTKLHESGEGSNPSNFLEIFTIRDGIVGNFSQNTQYNILANEFARRTFDESGDYYIKPFSVSVNNSLNDRKGNEGIFYDNQLTYTGNTPSDDIGVYRVSSGKAYVQGFETNLTSETIIDFSKPRTTESLENQNIVYYTGPTYSLNRVYGAPILGITTSYTVSLRDSRLGEDKYQESGKEIGIARVYDFALESGFYKNTLPDTNEWQISLYDVQNYTEITLNEPISLSTPTFIEGNVTGTKAFLRYPVSNSGIITAYNVSGNFAVGEKFIFDGIENTRVATSVTTYGISDVKSLYATSGAGTTFSADTLQYPSSDIGFVNITQGSGGISTVTTSNFNFVGIATVGNLVSYSRSGLSTSSFGKIITVSENQLTIAGVTTVIGICDGGLPTSDIAPSDFRILKSKFIDSSDNTLYTELGKKNISSVDLTNSQLIIKKQFDVVITSGSFTIPSTSILSNEFFLPFDEERYVLIKDDGSIEPLSEDKFFIATSKELTVSGLQSDGNAKLIATLRKTNIKSRVKNRNRVGSVLIDRSKYSYSGTNDVGVGNTTINDGLRYGNYPYGTRVQDEEICLNIPEVTKVHAIFEAFSTETPTPPSLVLTNILPSPSTALNTVVGEEIVGQTSGAVAICLEKLSTNNISFTYQNNLSFIEGESIQFKESNLTSTINLINSGSKNITKSYLLNNGQKNTILDYSRISRKSTALEPIRKIKVFYESATISDSDSGDITISNSYDQFNYCDLPTINGIRVSDIFDARVRVSEFNPDSASRSPFEFLGRSFSGSNNSALNILASDESISCGYNFYVGRIDRIFLSKNKSIFVKSGVPSENFKLPEGVSGALEIARITLPPYLCDLKDISISYIKNQRYQMSDISRLEDRVKNLEFYTSLSLLELNTKNLQIKDFNGLERFKNGIFVDNFTTTSNQLKVTKVKNSIDVQHQELRPAPFTTEIDLVLGSRSLLGIGTQANPSVDIKYANDLISNNIRRSGVNDQSYPYRTGKGVVTLDYDEIVEITQPYATRIENVTPFLVTSYFGNLTLNPSSDIWIDQIRLETLTVEGLEGETYTTELQLNSDNGEFDQQDGWSPVLWNAWENNWTSVNVVTTGNTITTTRRGTATRTGTSSRTLFHYNNVSIGDRIVDIDIAPFCRSRNIEFYSNRLKPFTQMYAFFDLVDMSSYFVPKLIEIEMLEGSFEESEEIHGYINISDDLPTFKARSAAPNHKHGIYNQPSRFYTTNPYDKNLQIEEVYSNSSTLLNIDTVSLAELSTGNYGGYIKQNMILFGQNSKARARVTDLRLVTDSVGDLIGCLYLPDPNLPENPGFKTGTKKVIVTSNQANKPILGEMISFADSTWLSDGLISKVQETILSIRDTEIQNATVLDTEEVEQVTVQQIVVNDNPPGWGRWDPVRRRFRDPLAQSFRISNTDEQERIGRFVTSIDLFFQSKAESLPCEVQLRTMSLGTPTETVYPFSKVVLYPEDIEVSDDATIPTRAYFEAPVYLESNKEHAVVILSDSTEYNVWISRVGEPLINFGDIVTETGEQVLTTNTNLGSLFKSQNASTWSPSQYEDLKFTLYSARFRNNGSISFFNPELNENNSQIAKLQTNPLQISSRKIRVGLSTIITDSNISIGNLITQENSNASGTYVGSAGSATGTLSIINSGIGFTPSIGYYNYENIPLTSVTGSGIDAKANISIEDGVAIAATVSVGGTGYVIGDILSASSIGINSLGRNMRLSVSSIGSTSEIILDNVQGDFVVGVGNTLKYSSTLSGVGVTYINGGGVYLDSSPTVFQDGLHIVVNHKNHGMHYPTNTVIISNVSSDKNPAKLTNEYLVSSSDDMVISSGFTETFSTFENVGVGTTNPGYILVNQEIISYTGVSGNLLTGITRGIDSTTSITHPENSLVYKYEVSGVSLRRINKSHELQDSDVENSIGLDYYTIKVGMNTNGVDRSTSLTGFPTLYLSNTSSYGGSEVRSTQNIPFEIARPVIETIEPELTSISCDIRTISGTSISGNEISFLDQSFEPISLQENNYFKTPRIVASKINETSKLTNFDGNKSMEVRLNLRTTDSRMSPMIDLDRVGMILTSNRVNKPIDDYIDDPRTSSLKNDPSAFVYATKPIGLELPASSIKIIVAAYINPYSDLRAFYAIMNGEEETPIYYPFPGYSNVVSSGQVINPANNDGSSDRYVIPNNTLGFDSNDITFKDYEFTIDNLESFRFYSIKLVATSTNQSYPPRLKDLRVISLA